MKIVVAFKIVPEYDKIPRKDLKKGDFYIGKNGFGFFCEGALRLALLLSDDLEALSFSTVDSIFVEKLYALGFKKVTILEGNNTDFNSKKTADVLYDYLKTTNYDLLLFGSMVGPNDSGMVPYYTAKNLGLKIIPNITFAEKRDDKYFIYSEDDENKYTYELKDKALGIVNNARYSYLPFTRYEDFLKAKDKKEARFKVKLKKEKNKVALKDEVIKKTSYINYSELLDMLRGKK